VDLLVYVEKAVALEVLSAFMEELRSESVNFRTRKWLDAILLAAIDEHPSKVGNSMPGLLYCKCAADHGHINLLRLGTPYGCVTLSLRTSTPTGLRPPPTTQRSEQQRGHYPTVCRRCQ
jgi:hypothetical protein